MTKGEIKAKVEKLYYEVDNESSEVWQGEKDLAHKYLRRVLDILDEYRDWLWEPMDIWGNPFFIWEYWR